MSGSQDNESLERASTITTPTSSYHSREDDKNTRLGSFENYPVPHNVSVLDLAKNGFMYDTSSTTKEVFCVGCGHFVQAWNIGDKPDDQRFHNNGCRFVRRGQQPIRSKTTLRQVRATSEQSHEENTKPFEPLPGPSNLNTSPTNTTQMMETQSLVVSNPKQPVQQVAEQSQSLPGRRMVAVTQMHRREEGRQSTLSLSHIHQETTTPPFQSGQSSLSSQSEISLRSSSHFQPASFHRQTSNSSLTSANLPSIPPNQVSRNFQRLENPDPVQEFIDQLDMRNAQHRLHTFSQYWSREITFRNVRLLVMCGFYCIGQDDAVECFCCHVICANWSRNDNPRQRHWEMSPHCRFIRGEECGDIPLAIAPQRRAPSPFQQLPPSIPQPSLSSLISSNPSPAHSMGHHPSLSPQVSHNISPSPSLSNVQPSTSQPHRSLSNVQPSENISPQESRRSTPVAQPSAGASPGGGSMDYENPSSSLIERSNWMVEFPCANPANPAMREEHARLQTFNNSAFRRNANLRANNETMAQAGLYYLGDGDRTKCWFCDGGLKDFEANDDPWEEHAKFYPECEYLLQQRGPGWVTRVSVQHPDVQRPILPARSGHVLPQVVSSPHPLPPPPPDRIEDPQQLLLNREQMVERGMTSDPVRMARAMGFSDETIREVQMRKVIRSNCCYQTNESLIDALLAPNEEAEADADPDYQEELPMDEGNVIDVSGQTIHIRGGNFIGPSVINGRVYNPQDQDPQGDTMFTYENRRPRGSNIIINGTPMEDFMNQVFENAFSSSPRYTRRTPIHHFNNRGITLSTRTVQRAPASAPTRTRVPRNTGSNVHTLSSPSTPAPAPAPTPVPRPPTEPTPRVATGTPEERVEQMERERRCKVCLTEDADILFQPCGHICACTSCSQRLHACPVCRRRIVRYIRTYHA